MVSTISPSWPRVTRHRANPPVRPERAGTRTGLYGRPPRLLHPTEAAAAAQAALRPTATAAAAAPALAAAVLGGGHHDVGSETVTAPAPAARTAVKAAPQS